MYMYVHFAARAYLPSLPALPSHMPACLTDKKEKNGDVENDTAD